MKDAFENSFKQNLDNFEMPYDDAAWDAMQSRLDAAASTPSFEDKMKEGLNANEYPYNPAAWTALSDRMDNGKKGGFKKWYLAAGLIGTAAVASLLIWNASDDNEAKTDTALEAQPSKAIHQTNAQAQGTNQAIVTENTAQTDITTSSGESNNTTATIATPHPFPQVTPANNQVNDATQASTNKSQGEQNTAHTERNQPTVNSSGSNSGTTVSNSEPLFATPVIPQILCVGTPIQIQNENDYPVIIVYPNGLNWTGQAHQITRLNPSISGNYKLGYEKNGIFVEESTFAVSDTPAADFDFLDLSQKYLNGVPTIEVRSTAKGTDYEWQYQNGTVRGEEVGLHFYEKGLHPVRLTVTNENGCSSTIEKSVSVDEDYKLIAMNAFNPNSVSQENIKFMPYALTERNVDFKMIILDPNDGHTMYETSDALEGWDGIDQSTGTMAPRETTYIWKVTIANPMPGENNSYTGVVTLL